MHRISLELVATAALLGMTLPTSAADIGIPAPYAPPPVVEAIALSGSWYLRGDVGVGIQQMGAWNIGLINNPPGNGRAGWLRTSIDDPLIVGVGVGYQMTDWLRGDITAEYRATTPVKGADWWKYPPAAKGYNSYDGSLSSTVVLANAYVDLGKHWGITPFVGVGLGGAYNRITGMRDIGGGIAAGSYGEFADKGKLNLAWALHGGASYDINPNLKLEASYRYLDMGEAVTGAVTCRPNRCKDGVQLTVRDLASHDIRIGMRWMLNPVVDPGYAPRPVVAKY